jgi:hypothetical protein
MVVKVKGEFVWHEHRESPPARRTEAMKLRPWNVVSSEQVAAPPGRSLDAHVLSAGFARLLSAA